MHATSITAEIFGEEIGITIEDIRVGLLSDQGYRRVQMNTEQGSIECHYYASSFAKKAVILVGSVGGSFDSPGNNLYPKLATELMKWQINSLRIRFRDPMDIGEGILDMLAGISFLQNEHIESIGLVGHSFGGAVAIQTAAAVPSISTVVSLASQSFGAEAITHLQDYQSVLLVHGKKDEVLPAISSVTLYQLAHEPKDIFFYNNASHNLNEVDNPLYEKVKTWILENV